MIGFSARVTGFFEVMVSLNSLGRNGTSFFGAFDTIGPTLRADVRGPTSSPIPPPAGVWLPLAGLGGLVPVAVDPHCLRHPALAIMAVTVAGQGGPIRRVRPVAHWLPPDRPRCCRDTEFLRSPTTEGPRGDPTSRVAVPPPRACCR